MRQLATLTTATALALILALGFGGTAKADPYADFVAVDGINDASCGGNCTGSASDTLGMPDGANAALGNLGFVTLNFTDNVCFVEDGDDVTVTELGTPEGYFVAVGLIGGALSAGVLGVGTVGIDLTSTGVSVFNQVKITDDGAAGPFVFTGADISAIECLNNFNFGTANIVKAFEPHPGDGDDPDEINQTSSGGFDAKQLKAFTITITNDEGEDLSGLILIDVVPAEFDLDPSQDGQGDGGAPDGVEVTAADGALTDCTASGAEGGAKGKGNNPAGKPRNQKLAPEVITIDASGLGSGNSCTITVWVMTDDDHPGRGNNPEWTPTSCPVTLNDGVKVFDSSMNLLFQDDDSLIFDNGVGTDGFCNPPA